jgi:superfamily II DNA or RNA helicase
VLYSLDFREAIAKKMLCTPKIMLLGYDLLSATELERVRVQLGEPLLTAEDAAKLLALNHALTHGPPRKAIAFCSLLADAEVLHKRLELLHPVVPDGVRALQSRFVPGTMSTEHRSEVMEEQRKAICTAVVTSARALQEGVDAPWCDTAIFWAPSSSALVATQMVGRALRLHGAGKSALIIVPMLNGNFTPIVKLVTALSTFDTEIAHLVHKLGARQGKRRARQSAAAD